jgi:SNF2 family DNA or RNA helicase
VRGAIVTIEGGKIRVVPSFGDLVVCGRLGGRYVPAARAWVFAATEKNARRLRAALRKLQASPEFEILISGAQPLAMSEPPPPSAEATGASANTQALVALVVAEPPLVIPKGILTQPWRHQAAALRFALAKFEAGRHGLLLAMGMGTGKTLVALILVLWLKAMRVMIACPLRVVSVWVGEIERHIGVRVVVVALDEDGGSVAEKMAAAAEKMKLAAAMGVPFIVVINFDSAWRDPFAAWAEKQQWDLVIADEQHRLKAPGGKASMSFKRIRKCAAYRLGLTGTPMPHGPMDIFAQFRFLDVTIFGPSFGAFRTKYAVMGGYQSKQITGFQHLDELERLMSQITFRVGSEVLDLPPATHVTYHCDLCPEARRVYKSVEDDFVAEVLDGRITATNALVKLIRLQQIANGVVKTDEGIQSRVDDAKRKLLADTLEPVPP